MPKTPVQGDAENCFRGTQNFAVVASSFLNFDECQNHTAFEYNSRLTGIQDVLKVLTSSFFNFDECTINKKMTQPSSTI